ncbi:MAG: RnfABCDGE type electron transport complex subunit B [Clostridia bacterium]|nr:RnfABCDGE type electron transport complex subunit B [Clostridia bacterium]
MDWILILTALGILAVLGAVFGVILGVAGKKFAVEVDERVERIRDQLGGANCGACGFAGCDAFAEAVVSGEARPDACTPGGAKTAAEIGRIMGVEVDTSAVPMVARVLCLGSNGVVGERYEYHGVRSCRVAAGLAGGPKQCRFSCIGLGDCALVCSANGIRIEDGLAKIEREKCIGCGMCINACPRNVIELVPADIKVEVCCRNTDVGKAAMSVCMRACVGCKRCERECPQEAIKVIDGYARIDHDKCTRCGICVERCPRLCIKFV